MKILLVTGEMKPYAWTGELGEDILFLAEALTARGHDVRVIMPLYQTICRDTLRFLDGFYVQLSWRSQYCGVFCTECNGIPVYFLDNEYYYNRISCYGEHDDGERFAFFSQAVLTSLPKIGFCPEILHTHDWQTALTAVYLKRCYQNDPFYRGILSVHTIHNAAYQGIFGSGDLSDVFGLGDWDRWVVENGGNINLTKGAVICADTLLTVSAGYAAEIPDDRVSFGLGTVLNENRGKLTGIPNGIDTAYYNPETKTKEFTSFREDPFDAKAANRRRLRAMVGLPQKKGTPLFLFRAPLTSEKGTGLLVAAVGELLQEKVQLIVSGCGEMRYERFFEQLALLHPEEIAYLTDDAKAPERLLYAGSDMILLPFRNEPCGRSQMIASRFGTVPVARETGGLCDTVIPYCTGTGEGNGFLFRPYRAEAFCKAWRLALEVWRSGEEQRRALLLNNLHRDSSWTLCAEKTEQVYFDLLRK